MIGRNTPALISIVCAAIFIEQGYSLLLCDNFCSTTGNVTCTCEDTMNSDAQTVWKLVTTSKSTCTVTLPQTGCANATYNCSTTIPGAVIMNDAYTLTTVCDFSVLYLDKNRASFEGLQIDCMSPKGVSYGSIGFSTKSPGPPTISATTQTLNDTHINATLTISASSGSGVGVPTNYTIEVTYDGVNRKGWVAPSSNGIATYTFLSKKINAYVAKVTAMNCAGAMSTEYKAAGPIVKMSGLILSAALLFVVISGLHA